MWSFRCIFRQLFFWTYLPPPPLLGPKHAQSLSARHWMQLRSVQLLATKEKYLVSRVGSDWGVKPPRLIFHMSYRNYIFGGTTFQLTKTCYSGALARLRLNVRRSVSCLCPVAIAVQESALRYRDLTYSWSGSDPPENWIWSPLSSIGP